MLSVNSMLAHREFGQGPRNVLFLHGLFGRGRDLEPFARRLLAGLRDTRALIPDLLAHGDSPQLPAGGNLAAMARAVAQWLDVLGVRARMPVVAHSMGGRIALRLHELFPERLGPFVLLDTPAGVIAEKRSPLSPFLRALAAAPDRAHTQEALLEPFSRVMMGEVLQAWVRARTTETPGGFGWNFDRKALVEYRNNTMDEDVWASVEALGSERLTVIVPKLSVYVRRAERERYAACGVEVQVLAGVKHDFYDAIPPDWLERIRGQLGLASPSGD